MTSAFRILEKGCNALNLSFEYDSYFQRSSTAVIKADELISYIKSQAVRLL